ncbi:MAG: rRNA maturation RNase YbeY [Candidatus Wildermuthbacteria bacterium]|nr:rRNA maturation RNase YbeY [Candidatus Wildermuthbacteria bacterium]
MLEIANLTKTKIDMKLLQKTAQEIFRKHRISRPVLSIVLVDSKRAQELNCRYRKKSYVPNVLSFKEPELGLGEIVLCPEKISQDAKNYGILFKEELLRVFIHGVLHLLGYSHYAMKKKEAEYYSLFVKR